MKSIRSRRIFRIVLALLVLTLSLVAKIPTSHCHCQESKSTAQQRAVCPFGQLRALSGDLLASVTAVALVVKVFTIFQLKVFTHGLGLMSARSIIDRARGPPMSVATRRIYLPL